MFLPEETFDMPDPFDVRNQPIRRRRADCEHLDHVVGRFTLSQPKPPSKALTRSEVGRALHRIACEAKVLGTVYEGEIKVWRKGCKFDVVPTLPVAIHGKPLAVSKFMRLMETKASMLDKLIKPGDTLKVRTIAALGGKPGDHVGAPKGKRYTLFGRRWASSGAGESRAESKATKASA